MRIVERIGSVIDGEEPVLVHGCNALGEMGAGVAQAVRDQIPFAYRVYRRTYLRRGLYLGEVIWAINVTLGMRPRIIGNAITQANYGPGGRRYVDYEAIVMVMRATDDLAARSQRPDADDGLQIAGMPPITAVGMPMIGAGLGGGDWSQIAPIIEQESRHFTPIVYRLA